MSAELASPLPLTPLEADALRIIQEFIEIRGHAPSRRDLMRELGCGSPYWPQRLVESLHAKGWIRHHTGRHFGIEVLHFLPEATDCEFELTDKGRAYLADMARAGGAA